MDPQTRLRYVRHILLPEIGEAGQRLLCDTTVAAHEAEWALLYLLRAGLKIADDENNLASDREGDSTRPSNKAGDQTPAERALLGSLRAVELIKSALTIGDAAPPNHYKHMLAQRNEHLKKNTLR